jgi:signal transduction histidine kinase/CheY-like chemotaxis protein
MKLTQANDSSAMESVRSSLEGAVSVETEEITTLKRSLKSYLDVLESSTAHEAIARSTQAFAHDVRKPFSMFKALIESVESTSDLQEIRNILRSGLPEISVAMASVDAMVVDMMQIGHELDLSLESVNPTSLIEASVREISLIFSKSKIEFEYNLNHTFKVEADTLRVARVFSNILSNAIQAMNETGKIWFSTKDKGDFVEFAIGNSGPHISPDSLARLFDVFYTSGKRGGTGLGLAISKKIVERHGGSIRCQNLATEASPKGNVEFVFCLRKTSRIEEQNFYALAETTADVLRPFPFLSADSGPSTGGETTVNSDERIIKRIRHFLARLPEKPSILIVDDEAVYRNSLLNLFGSLKFVSSSFHILTATTGEEACTLIAERSPTLVIQDVDLGKRSIDGLEVVRSVRKSGFAGYICIHSNRLLIEDSLAPLRAGADSVLPKPMNRAHLLQMLDACLERAKSFPAQNEFDATDASVEDAVSIEHTRPRIAYVDDSEFLLLVMKKRFQPHADISTFSGFDKFWSGVGEGTLNGQFDLILLDYFLSPEDHGNGLDLAAQLRAKGFAGPIVLMSDVPLNPDDLQPARVAAHLSKAADWPMIESFLKSRSQF